jgi:hypothetical protein
MGDRNGEYMSGGSAWLLGAAAEDFASHDYADLAQEFLRRNADYRQQYDAMDKRIADDPETARNEQEGLAGRWGLSFPFRP